MGFKLSSRQGFYGPSQCDLDPKINREHLWGMTYYGVSSLIGFKFLSGQELFAQGHCDLGL